MTEAEINREMDWTVTQINRAKAKLKKHEGELVRLERQMRQAKLLVWDDDLGER